MSLATGLRVAWGLIKTKPNATGLRVLPFEDGGRIRATVNNGGQEGILITVRAGENILSTVAAIRRSTKAIGAEVYEFSEDGQGAKGLHIWCASGELVEAFIGFCEPFILRIERGEAVGAAFSVCFEEFRRLVAGLNDEPLLPAFAGLLGELLILSELVTLDREALAYWHYPALERHDFRNGLAALEVKTTLRSQQGNPSVTISAFDQLEPPTGGTLHLHWLRLERDVAGAISLDRLLERIAERAAPGSLDELRSRILRHGAITEHRSQAFALQERRSFRVVASFPRLTSSRLTSGELDAGISRVTYQLDLSSAADFECPPDEANQALVSGLGGG